MTETGLAFRIMRRELRGGLRGFYIFLLCLILGVGTIAGVRSLSHNLLDSLEDNGRAILGGDMTFRTLYQPAEDEKITYLRNNLGPTTIVAETRAMVRLGDQSRANLAEVKAVDQSYPLYDNVIFTDENGTQQNTAAALHEALTRTTPDALPGALIEPELTELIGLSAGDQIFIGDQGFIIRGIIKHEPDRLSGQRFSYAPRVMINRKSLAATGLTSMGSQMIWDHKTRTPDAQNLQDLQAVKTDVEAAFPDADWEIRNYFNAAPTIERFIERLTLFLTLVGLTALLVGGVGIGNAVRSYLETKYTDIATLKCVGASRRMVFKIYFYQILTMGAIGIIGGCVIGAVVPPLIIPLLTEQLALGTASAQIYISDLGLAALFGVLTLICFSLYPLTRACEVKSADLFRGMVSASHIKTDSAIIGIIGLLGCILAVLAVYTATDRGLAAGFVIGTAMAVIIFLVMGAVLRRMLRLLRRTRQPSIRFAIANLYRPGNITDTLVLSLGLGLTIFIAIGLIEYNFSQKLERSINADTPSFFFLDIQASQREDFEDALQSVTGAKNLKTSPLLHGQIITVNDVPAAEALVEKDDDWVLDRDRRLTYTADNPDSSTILDGEWWPADYNGAPLVSVSDGMAEALGLSAGDQITVRVMGLDIVARVANVRDIDWSTFAMNFALTFAPGALEDAPATWIATVSVPTDQEMQVQSRIAADFPNVSAIRVRDAMDLANSILSAVATAVRYSAAITLLAGILVLGGAIAAGQKRRIYDAVVFKVLGVRRRQMMGVFLTEYFILGLVTVLMAALLGTVAAWAILTRVMELDWNFSIMTVVYVGISALMLSVGFGLIATWRILGVRPAPFLRNE